MAMTPPDAPPPRAVADTVPAASASLHRHDDIPDGNCIRARAPLRISFCGGGTDLAEYAAVHGGQVLSATIQRYAYATVRPLDRPVVRVESLDYHQVAHYAVDEPLIYDGKFDLIKAVLRRLNLETVSGGLDLFLETDAPPGSGLGASSSLVVAVIAAMANWRRLSLGPYDVAALAYDVERRDVGIAGGMQDQYSAAFGGFNLIEFRGAGDVLVNPLRIDKKTVRELEYNSLLVFTGGTRLSSHIIESQVRNYNDDAHGTVETLHRMKALAGDAKDALLRGNLGDLGDILHEQWQLKKATSDAISTPRIDELYDEMRRLGAVGGKMCGAGGGGFMYVICPFDAKARISERLTEMGAEVSAVRFEFKGAQSWMAGQMSARRGGV